MLMKRNNNVIIMTNELFRLFIQMIINKQVNNKW